VAAPTFPSGQAVRLRGRILRILWVFFRIFVSYFFLSLASRFISRPTKTRWMEQLHHQNASLFFNTILSLKGLMIKVGQFMSARIDLLPGAYTKTLSRLQDEVPPAPFSEIRKKLIAELGDPPETLFLSFNEVPLASASLGQVHEAVLKTPEAGKPINVAIKIQYPDIESIVETDLRAIALVVQMLKKIFAHIQFDILFREFSRMVYRELNYMTEAKNAEKFYNQFQEDDRFVVPQVVWTYTTERVLTLTRVTGIKINRFDEIQRAGISLKEVARLLVESYMKQILVYRFFHGDPHPGNLFVQPAGNGPKGKLKLVFVDFGLMQEIDEKTDRGMHQIILAIINRDIPSIARALVELGFITKGGKVRDIEPVVQFFMDRYRDISPRAFRQITIGDITEDLKTLFTVYPFLQVPNLFILAGRAVGMLNGLCSQLDQDVNIIELAQPYARKYAARPGFITEIFSKGKDILRSFLSLPEALQSFLDLGQSSGVETHMHSETLERALTRIYKLAYRTIFGALAVSALIYIRLTPEFHFMTPAGQVTGAILIFSMIALIGSLFK
jgi:predicted unusual protein kinase regulating ubiquinone biosynthesis (AarF/ABC1/UbiB family)